MGPTRFPYGQALGFQNQFSFTQGPTASGTAGLISGSTAPNVTLGNLFYVNNTGSLTITNFLLDDTANRITQYEGKVIRLFCLDTGSTSINVNSAITVNLNQNSTLEYMFSRGSWFPLDPTDGQPTSTYVTNVQSSLNINGVAVALLNNTGGTTNSIIALSGGYIGQEVTFMQVGSNATRILAGGNIFMTVTNAVLVNASGVYKAVKFDAASWRLLAVNSGGAL